MQSSGRVAGEEKGIPVTERIPYQAKSSAIEVRAPNHQTSETNSVGEPSPETAIQVGDESACGNVRDAELSVKKSQRSVEERTNESGSQGAQ